jgi:hypothetical protein
MTKVRWQSRQIWISVSSDSTVLSVFCERQFGQGRGTLVGVLTGRTRPLRDGECKGGYRYLVLLVKP